MIFCNLGSGSKGNSTYVQDDGPAFLIDQGFSLKNLLARMDQVGLDPHQVSAILLTHEHSDHLHGVGIFARRFDVPLYTTSITRRKIPEKIVKNVRIVEFTAGDELNIAGMKVKTFHIPHDAVDPVGLVISGKQHRIGIVTDIGNEVQYLREYLNNLDLLFLESNHDPVMLDNGPYPLWLRQRIKSRDGHLSNKQASALFRQLNLNGRLKHLILAHLSEQNNTPDLVLKQFALSVEKREPPPQLYVATQHEPGVVIEL
ncbi:MAG: MBL fold metallo-hydrolase [Candidatus Marinimicrobia bacterium]|nr:MBL fold metallo-hydrolase [Candidatus Neomarinimicrobiota bacterium]